MSAPEHWLCPTCGHFNEWDLPECQSCGFETGPERYDDAAWTGEEGLVEDGRA